MDELISAGERGDGPFPAGDLLRALQERLRERGVEPRDCSDDTPEARTREVRARQAAVARQVWRTTLETWPERGFADASLEGLDGDQQVAGILQWLQNPQARLLILAGKTGRGKSHAAFAVGNRLAQQGRTVRAVKHYRYVEALMPDGDDAPEREAGSAGLMKKRVMQAGLFLLDEFGAGMPTVRGGAASPFAQRVTGDLLSMRLRSEGRRTIVTTNYSFEELQRLFEDRILSRLLEAATVLIAAGPDRRAAAVRTWNDLR